MWPLSMFRDRRRRRARPDRQPEDESRRARRIKSAMLAEQIQRERGNAESRGF